VTTVSRWLEKVLGGACILWVMTIAAPVEAQPFQTGDVFASTNGGVLVYRPNAAGVYEFIRFFNTIVPGASDQFAAGSAFDAAGNFYVTGFSSDMIFRFTPGAGDPRIDIPAGGRAPESIVFDAAGNFYVGISDPVSPGLRGFTPAGAPLVAFTVPSVAREDRGVDWIDLASDQRTMYYTSEGNRILRFDLVAGTPLADFARINTDLTRPCQPTPSPAAPHFPFCPSFAMRLLSDGGLVVAARNDIRRFNAAGDLIQIYDAPNADFFFSLNLDPDGVSFWSGDSNTGFIYRFLLAAAAPIASFQAVFANDQLFGVAVFGERTQGTQAPPEPEPPAEPPSEPPADEHPPEPEEPEPHPEPPTPPMDCPLDLIEPHDSSHDLEPPDKSDSVHRRRWTDDERRRGTGPGGRPRDERPRDERPGRRRSDPDDDSGKRTRPNSSGPRQSDDEPHKSDGRSRRSDDGRR
jgi:hypothetical protein